MIKLESRIDHKGPFFGEVLLEPDEEAWRGNKTKPNHIVQARNVKSNHSKIKPQKNITIQKLHKDSE